MKSNKQQEAAPVSTELYDMCERCILNENVSNLEKKAQTLPNREIATVQYLIGNFVTYCMNNLSPFEQKSHEMVESSFKHWLNS